MKIKITSPCMAMLAYEASKSVGQNCGCLCGEITTETTKNITDSDVTVTTEEVLSANSLAFLNLDDNNFSTKTDESNVYGWYKFCRRPFLRLTVREKSIHRKLANNLKTRMGSPAHLVTVLIQEQWSENQSTYLWKFAAYILKDNRLFVPCQVEIVNLRAAICGAYKPYPTVHQRQRLPQVTRAMSNLGHSFSSENANCTFHMVNAVRNTGQEIVDCLNDTINKLRATEVELQSAYNEQDRLKETLHKLQAEKDKKDGGSNNGSFTDENDLNLSEETETSDSSESGEYYGEEKANELLHDLKSKTDNTDHLLQRDFDIPNDIECPPEVANSTVAHNENSTAYDPFDSLVDIAKANLQKKESQKNSDVNEDESQLAEYNEEHCENI